MEKKVHLKLDRHFDMGTTTIDIVRTMPEGVALKVYHEFAELLTAMLDIERETKLCMINDKTK